MRSLRMPATSKGCQTRTRLLEAAEAEFGLRGYHGAATHKIAQLAGVASGTLYLYFSGKAELVRAVLARLTQQMERVLKEAAAGARNTDDARQRCLKAYVEYMRQHAGARRIVQEVEFVDSAAFRQYQEALTRLTGAAHWDAVLGGPDAQTVSDSEPVSVP